MPTDPLRIEATRGPLVESVHHVSAAVVHQDGRLLAAAGNPELVTWWRSAAKPFQALPLLLDGAAEAFRLSDEELALACASHSSEPRHLEVISALLSRTGLCEQDLACGPHPPLSPTVAQAVARSGATLSPRWSNCSGKHAGMLLLAKHHGWPLAGYHSAGHPVQDRVLDEVSRWSGLPASDIPLSVDGCTAVCFGLPLRAMAAAYARLGEATAPAPRRIVSAMTSHPFLVAGTGRLCTDLMAAWPGKVIAKVGAEGIYSAALPGLGFGIALKVEDGDMASSGIALLEALRQTLERLAPQCGAPLETPGLVRHAHRAIHNTRGAVTGEVRAAGRLHFFAA